MSQGYRAVRWNRQKRAFDAVLACGVLGYLATFLGTGAVLFPDVTLETLSIRAFGTASFVLIQILLCIGPLCRLAPRFLPLLYHRRHLGVTVFALALVHGALSMFQFHAFGDLDALASALSATPRIESVSQLPFQPFGLLALVILFAMAATSHEFWLKNLTPPVWKTLHMGAYVAYGLLVAHVSLGALQSAQSPLYAGLLALGLLGVVGLHLAAGRREARLDRSSPADVDPDGFVPVCPVDEIENDRARVAFVGGERVAVFRYDGKLSAVSNVCPHQNGPLGEGRIIDGCITCPWHGYRYEPASGRAPAPFPERIPTFRLRVRDGTVYIDPRPNPPGTPIDPVRVERRERDA